MPLLLSYFVSGVVGIWINVFLVKIPKLKILSSATNHPFTFKQYFKDDWQAIAGSNLCVILVILAWKELIGISPDYIGKYPVIFFATIGFTGGQFILSGLSVASRKITGIISIKSNGFDGIVPPVNATNVEGVSEIKKDSDMVEAVVPN